MIDQIARAPLEQKPAFTICCVHLPSTWLAHRISNLLLAFRFVSNGPGLEAAAAAAAALKGPNYTPFRKSEFHPSLKNIGNQKYSLTASSIVHNLTWWFVLLGVYGWSGWCGTAISSEVMSSRTKRPDPLGLKPRRGLISTNTLKIICLPMKSICGFRIDSNSVATSELTRKRTHSKRLCLVSTLCLSRLWASCMGRTLVWSSNQIKLENRISIPRLDHIDSTV